MPKSSAQRESVRTIQYRCIHSLVLQSIAGALLICALPVLAQQQPARASSTQQTRAETGDTEDKTNGHGQQHKKKGSGFFSFFRRSWTVADEKGIMPLSTPAKFTIALQDSRPLRTHTQSPA